MTFVLPLSTCATLNLNLLFIFYLMAPSIKCKPITNNLPYPAGKKLNPLPSKLRKEVSPSA
jgi:hypothetical protein